MVGDMFKPEIEKYDLSSFIEVPEDSIEAKLFSIIDDMDTAGDMFKPKIEGYEKYINSKVKEAQKYIISDGHKLYYRKQVKKWRSF